MALLRHSEVRQRRPLSTASGHGRFQCDWTPVASELTVGAARIFLRDGWHPDEAGDLTVTAAPNHQGAKQAFDIDPVSLYATGPAVDLQARRVHDPARNSCRREAALDPKTVIARFNDAIDSNRYARAPRRRSLDALDT
jgi:hypothetical protein